MFVAAYSICLAIRQSFFERAQGQALNYGPKLVDLHFLGGNVGHFFQQCFRYWTTFSRNIWGVTGGHIIPHFCNFSALFP